MSLALHEIAESRHRIQNPFSDAKLALLGEVARIGRDTRILDLACGKGELLSTWAAAHGSRGTGVDVSEVFLRAAEARAVELGVSERIEYVLGDAGRYDAEPGGYDVASCIGATWIGGGLLGTLQLLHRAVRPDGLILVGEPYWITDPPDEAYNALNIEAGEFVTLPLTLQRFEAAGADLVEMVLAEPYDFDRYESQHWWNLTEWLDANPADDLREQVRAFRDHNRLAHLEFQRRYLGWGVFVLRPSQPA